MLTVSLKEALESRPRAAAGFPIAIKQELCYVNTQAIFKKKKKLQITMSCRR